LWLKNQGFEGIFVYTIKVGGYIIPELSLMMLDSGSDMIRCRFVCDWFKMDSYVRSNEDLLSEIEKNKPDIVFIDLDIYARIDGVETSRRIRNQFDIPVMYV